MTTIIVGPGNAEIFRYGIHWSNDRILLCKSAIHIKILILHVQNAFCGDPRLMSPRTHACKTYFYDYNKSKSVVFK